MSHQEGSGQRLHARSVLQRHTDRLLGMPGVVTTGLGYVNGRYVISVGLLEDAPVARELPSAIEGVPVAVSFAGSISAEEL